MLFYILTATVLVSLVSLIGIIFLGLKKDFFEKTMESMISFAIGGLLGGALIHLLPEAVEAGGSDIFLYVVIGLLFFFVMEKFLKWRHCHEAGCDIHAFTYLSLIGDAVHNFIDGMVIAASFYGGFELGVATTVAVLLHEIPQEIGDFAVLVYGGFSKGRALFLNFMTALTAIIGAVLAYYLLFYLRGIEPALLAATAGGFLYIALVDLVPELHKKWGFMESASQATLMIAGGSLMFIMKLFLRG